MRLGTNAPSAGPRWAIAEFDVEARPARALLHAIGPHVLEIDLFTAVALATGRGPLELVELKGGFPFLPPAIAPFTRHTLRSALARMTENALLDLIDEELGMRVSTELRLLCEGYWPRAAPALCTKCDECGRWNYHLAGCARRGLR